MRYTKIYPPIIIGLIALVLLIVTFFAININVKQTVTFYRSDNEVKVIVDKKHHDYIKKQDENKSYYFYNITKDSDVKCSLHNVQVQDNYYIYEAWMDQSNYPVEGFSNTTLDFGSMKIFQYFVYF